MCEVFTVNLASRKVAQTFGRKKRGEENNELYEIFE
jgi:hypothetical protein